MALKCFHAFDLHMSVGGIIAYGGSGHWVGSYRSWGLETGTLGPGPKCRALKFRHFGLWPLGSALKTYRVF